MRRGAALALACALVSLPLVAAARDLEYLYIDASEGGGSGGHVALALGEHVFHFEHRPPGLLHLVREPRDVLVHRYGVAQNRTIVVIRIAVSEETYGLIEDELALRRLVQRQHLADYRQAVDDRRLIAAVLAGLRAATSPDGRGGGHHPAAVTDMAIAEAVEIEGAGFFVDSVVPARAETASAERSKGTPGVEPAAAPLAEPDGLLIGDSGGAPPTDPSALARSEPDTLPAVPAAALVRLRSRALAVRGADALDRARRRAAAELAALRPEAGAESPAPLAADRLGPGRRGVAARYRDALTEAVALETLAAARPLRPGSARAHLPALAPGDAGLVGELAARLEDSLVALLGSRRPDRGFALLLWMARLIALDETLSSGRWVLLEPTATAPQVVPRARLRAQPALAGRLGQRAASDFAAARDGLRRRAASSEGFPEVQLTALEAAASRLAEADAAAAGRDLVLAWGVPLPARPAPLARPPVLDVDEPALAGALEAAAAREAALGGELDRLYGYHLITRNCVTEIFRAIDAALARAVQARDPAVSGEALAARVRAESVRRLGGYVDPAGPLVFIPAVSASAAERGYAGSSVVELPSYRRREVDRMSGEESPAWVFLRESNTLTSTLYRCAHDDSAFVFFTDDRTAARPLLGALNLLAGLGVAAAGVATWPADGGALLTAGLKGAMFSLPELAFFNIRKGSFPDLERR